jgi:trans-2,3-dihydro-3-hydroxyanthranilate isomerase
MANTIHVWQVDVFTSTPLAGNPAGVVRDADGLSDAQMQAIAREMALSETAFLLQPTARDADFRIRWFTPLCEVRICGHATIAACHVLAEEGGIQNVGTYRFAVETLSGILPVTVEGGPQRKEIHFGLPLPVFRSMAGCESDLKRLLKVGSGDRDQRFDIVSDGEHIYLALNRLRTVQALKPNMAVLSAYLDATGHTGVCAYTTETVERQSHVHSRLFAPNVGIPEDPVTGSANGPLGVLLAKRNGIPDGSSTVRLVGEQGDEIGRAGRVTITVRCEGSEPVSVSVGGMSVTVMHARMLIPGG